MSLSDPSWNIFRGGRVANHWTSWSGPRVATLQSAKITPAHYLAQRSDSRLELPERVRATSLFTPPLTTLPWSTRGQPCVSARGPCPAPWAPTPLCPSCPGSPPTCWWPSWPGGRASAAARSSAAPRPPRCAWSLWSTAWMRGSSRRTCRWRRR